MAYQGIAGVGLMYPSANSPLAGAGYAGLNEITSSFVIEKAVDETDVIGWRPGSDICQQETVRTINGAADWQMTVTFQELTWELLQHIFQEFAANSTGYISRKSFSFRVPTTAPYEVADARITAAATVATTSIGYTERGTWGERGPISVVGAAPAGAAQAQLDGAGGRLVFDAAAAGAVGVVQLDFAEPATDTLLVEANPLSFATMDFTGTICTEDYASLNGIGVRAYEMVPSQSFSLNLENDAPAPEIVYNLRTQTGRRSPIEFFRLAA